jgi:MoxR-like ATPase
VVATQNPAEFHGTYPLPESQLDRFILAAEMGPPTQAEAMEVLARREHGDPIADLAAVVDIRDVVELQDACLRVVAAPAIRTYIVSLLDAIRSRPEVLLPASLGPVRRTRLRLARRREGPGRACACSSVGHARPGQGRRGGQRGRRVGSPAAPETALKE